MITPVTYGPLKAVSVHIPALAPAACDEPGTVRGQIGDCIRQFHGCYIGLYTSLFAYKSKLKTRDMSSRSKEKCRFFLRTHSEKNIHKRLKIANDLAIFNVDRNTKGSMMMSDFRKMIKSGIIWRVKWMNFYCAVNCIYSDDTKCSC